MVQSLTVAVPVRNVYRSDYQTYVLATINFKRLGLTVMKHFFFHKCDYVMRLLEFFLPRKWTGQIIIYTVHTKSFDILP